MNQLINVKPAVEAAEYRYARGWHCLGEAKDYRDGQLHTLNIFGTRLLAFADEQGAISILDAYCPHMGADLSQGELVNGKVVCPFHHWAFDASGRCAEIPYCKRIPPKAKTRKWLTCEENNLLFVWNNPEGKPPAEGVEIPHLPEIDSDEWDHDWHLDLMMIDTNPRELVDNLVDAQHFGPVHGTPTKYFRNTFKEHIGTQLFMGDSERLGGDLIADSAYYGPATHFTRMRAEYDGLLVESILLNCHVPVGPNQFELRFGVLVKKIPGWTEEQNKQLALDYVKQNRESFYQDVDIWSHKRRVDMPVLAEGDGPIYQLREWYQQFFMDEADVPAMHKELREFIVVDNR
ncbi:MULTISPECIES: Rieske 2Fe-2S domain-containing protein [Halopseudomonas]|uniref:3-ketosteroid 9alpha-monooxygenase subunit A n=1 Tax=Halopseudomonas aestusnigri TaxID=857252 RepID=A0AAQ1G614_9GAMM|nr:MULTISPECIES: Rieske 2Fe-2S domain-containing protein [Halopseudomonas]OWL89420.1 3-ketosteroid-9-alpha-hydroxylase [Halopseudomonas aestusnigri]SEG03823.1 3-ketosteroid 9alpha-monooxygenase subunit A [Halopseudomonas aestusnigri]